MPVRTKNFVLKISRKQGIDFGTNLKGKSADSYLSTFYNAFWFDHLLDIPADEKNKKKS